MQDDQRKRLQQTIDAHFAAVGKVAAFWSELERQLQMAIWKLAGIDAFKGACITSRIRSSATLLEAIVDLLQLKGFAEHDLELLNEFGKELGELQSRRDRIVHDPWSFRIVDAFPHRKELNSQNKTAFGYVPHSTKEVEAFAESISDLVQRLETILNALVLHLDESQERSA